MADSVGNGFPITNLNVGWTHYYISRRILYVWNGGDPADESTWSEIGGSSASVIGEQRWPWYLSGADVSVGSGVSGELEFIIPSDGIITGWGVIVGSVPTPVEFDIELRDDPFGGADPIDIITLPISSTQLVEERNISFVVSAGDVIGIFEDTTLNPAVLDLKISGYIDFTPS